MRLALLVATALGAVACARTAPYDPTDVDALPGACRRAPSDKPNCDGWYPDGCLSEGRRVHSSDGNRCVALRALRIARVLPFKHAVVPAAPRGLRRGVRRANGAGNRRRTRCGRCGRNRRRGVDQLLRDMHRLWWGTALRSLQLRSPGLPPDVHRRLRRRRHRRWPDPGRQPTVPSAPTTGLGDQRRRGLPGGRDRMPELHRVRHQQRDDLLPGPRLPVCARMPAALRTRRSRWASSGRPPPGTDVGDVARALGIPALTRRACCPWTRASASTSTCTVFVAGRS
jgi:hypothetical protein